MAVIDSAEAPALQLPYLSFGSFKNFLDRLRTEGAVPGRIDRPFLGGSGAYQSQMIQTLKYLGLVDADLRTQDSLRYLALADDEARQPLFAALVTERYPALLALGDDATSSQLEEEIRKFGLTGDTVRKAASLYLALAKHGEVPVSKWFKVTKTASAPGKRKIIRRTKTGAVAAVQTDEQAEEVAVTTPPSSAPGAAGSTTIPLASGGHLTFSYSVDLMAMSRSDRDFVFELIDQMKAYQQAQKIALDSRVVGDTDDDLDADEGD